MRSEGAHGAARAMGPREWALAGRGRGRAGWLQLGHRRHPGWLQVDLGAVARQARTSVPASRPSPAGSNGLAVCSGRGKSHAITITTSRGRFRS